MVESEIVENGLAIDWDHLNLPDDLDFVQPTGDGLSRSPNSGCSMSIYDIEQHLMNEECNYTDCGDILADEFLADVLIDYSPESESDRAKDTSLSPESVEVETEEEEKEQDKDRNGLIVPPMKADSVVGEEEDDNDDPDAKKRKRKLRNKDAAVRSRERKKMYVRDLELKSKYYEAECRRLGMILQGCLAENQVLRLSLHNKAFDASMTKQESAVLFLESLLLGSLLGFLGIIYLLILPSHLLSTLETSLVQNKERPEWESLAPRKAESRALRSLSRSFMLGKRFKASRSRMRLRPFSVAVKIENEVNLLQSFSDFLDESFSLSVNGFLLVYPLSLL